MTTMKLNNATGGGGTGTVRSQRRRQRRRHGGTIAINHNNDINDKNDNHTARSITIRPIDASYRRWKTRGFVAALGLLGCSFVVINVYVLSSDWKPYQFHSGRGRGRGARMTPPFSSNRPMIHGIAQPNRLFMNDEIGGAMRTTAAIRGYDRDGDQNHHHRNRHDGDDDDDWDGKGRVVRILREATIHVNGTMRERLPTWERVVDLVGEHPRFGYATTGSTSKSTCEAFRDRVPPVRRMIGAAGMFSTGTNLVTTLLKQNCQVPQRVAKYGTNATKELHVSEILSVREREREREGIATTFWMTKYTVVRMEGKSIRHVDYLVVVFDDVSHIIHHYELFVAWFLFSCFASLRLYNINRTENITHTHTQGMRWQVPWGKHTPAHYKYSHAAKMAARIDKDDVLPVISIRNPYLWMKSMCKNPYAARWEHRRGRDDCPNLLRSAPTNDDDNVTTSSWNPVTVTYGAGTETYQSLVHLFNDWYHEYIHNATYPWIMIRMEGKMEGAAKMVGPSEFRQKKSRRKKYHSTRHARARPFVCYTFLTYCTRSYLSHQGNHHGGMRVRRGDHTHRPTLRLHGRFRQGGFPRSRHIRGVLRGVGTVRSSRGTPRRLPFRRL